MAEHLAVCEEELVPCKYTAIGCAEEVMKRKDLQTHLQDKKNYHLESSMDMVMQHNMVLVYTGAKANVYGIYVTMFWKVTWYGFVHYCSYARDKNIITLAPTCEAKGRGR